MCRGKFISLKKLYFTQDNVEKIWEIASIYDSVAVLIYNTTQEAFVLVKQFRPPVFLKNNDGFTYELCAGICDKDIPLSQIAIEEVYEETGYKIDGVEKINSFWTAVGSAGAKQTLFYAEVTDDDRVNAGGGIDNEKIEVIHLAKTQLQNFMEDENIVKTPGLLYAIEWWLNKDKKC
ncbi:MAG: NUDIX domain-containing protein [Epsilonproteobacteria bacterium]|nr:NUDIX domain-containing protein [Campylobacterota bacterium]